MHTEPQIDPKKIKSVIRCLPLPPLPDSLLKLITELHQDTVTPLGNILRLVMGPSIVFDEVVPKKLLFWAEDAIPRDEKEATLHDQLLSAGPKQSAALQRETGLSAYFISKALKKGLIVQRPVDADQLPRFATKGHADKVSFNEGQRKAVLSLISALKTKAFRECLLRGEPGSGKTEIYFEAVEKVLDDGGSALILLPEIALSTQWTQRFKRRFGLDAYAWHSGIPPNKRRALYKAVAKGEIKVMVGARSAAFLPFPSLDLIVIDEEHDLSFKQSDGIVYDMRKVAQMRARHDEACLIYCSATPSLDTQTRLKQSRALQLHLPRRLDVAAKPKTTVIDLKKDQPLKGAFLSSLLKQKLEQNLNAGEQSLLFLNRRGYAPLTMCRACGFRFCCPNCTAWMTYHHLRGRFQCHHCGHSQPKEEHCPSCGALECLVPIGPGVERICDELKREIPQARQAVMTSDTMSSSEKAGKTIEAVLQGEVDILVGTQLVAKGHHFPELTLVGVVDADLGLRGGDPRAAERTFQLLYQLRGRAGREQKQGQIFIQTREPGHPVIRALADGGLEDFYEAELEERLDAGLPPYGRLASIILSGPVPDAVRKAGREVAEVLGQERSLYVLGPAPAPLAMLRGRYRERILIKAGADIALPILLRERLKNLRLASQLRMSVDIDPQSFL